MFTSLIISWCLLCLVHSAAACTDTVYVGTDNGHLAISKNGGGKWSTVLSTAGYINDVKANGKNVYAGTQSGLAISHDGGASWSMKNLPPSSGCDSTVISIFVDEAKRVYALFGTKKACGRVAVSSDNGDTWPINFPLPTTLLPPKISVQNMYVDGPRIYVATTDYLYFTDDMGPPWTLKDQSSGLASNWLPCVIGQGPSVFAGLLGGDGGRVSISKDSGRTFKTVNTTPKGLNDYAKAMYLQDDTLYVATMGGGLSWSSDFSTWTWQTTTNGLASNNTRAIITSGNNIYLGTQGGGLSISRDKGQTWITKTTKDGLPSNNTYAVFAQCV